MGVFLLLGGMAAASSNSASGRLVVGWFPPQQRGLVMGIRQTAQPLGVAFGALVIPRLAQTHGVGGGTAVPGGGVRGGGRGVRGRRCSTRRVRRAPRRPPSDLANPYRGSDVLWRIHAVSVLLVVPQCVVWTFTPGVADRPTAGGHRHPPACW